LKNITIEIKYIDNAQKIILNQENIDNFIRTPIISIYASDVSAIPEVREFLLNLQRDIASRNNCIMDGRDIGTVILPNAQLKIFLTASAQERAKRRFLELQQKGEKVSFEEVLNDITYRDENDSKRAHAPLKAADDAIVIDTSVMDFNNVFELIKSMIKEQFKNVL
jgi:cytidylate kinase